MISSSPAVVSGLGATVGGSVLIGKGDFAAVAGVSPPYTHVATFVKSRDTLLPADMTYGDGQEGVEQ